MKGVLIILTHKRKTAIFIIVLLLIILGGCTKKTPSSAVSSDRNPLNLSKQTPLIFLHGSGGDQTNLLSFAEKVTSVETNNFEQLSVVITADQQLTYLNYLTNKQAQPLIFVGFADHSAPIEEWSHSLEILLKDLKKLYQFEQVNLIGFSNGGLAAAYYAETTNKQSKTPQLTKLVAIGAPFNDLEPLNTKKSLNFTDLSGKNDYLETFLSVSSGLSTELTVLSIAGSLTPTSLSDGVVPVTSALSSRLIFLEQVKLYQEQLSTGPNASHVGLISENSEVVNWVHDFLFEPEPNMPQLIK